MNKSREDTQMALDLVSAPAKPQTSGRVVTFVSARTRAVREDAVRRVAQSGIFAAPTSTGNR